LGGIPLLALGLWGLRRFRKRMGHDTHSLLAPEVGFYHRWQAVVAQHFPLRPQRAQTPRGVAGAGVQNRARRPAARPLREVSRQVVRLYYRVRYGQRPLHGEECTAIERQVDELDATLRAGNS